MPPPRREGQIPDLGRSLDEVERGYVQSVLGSEGGHVPRAAARLGISKTSLYQRLRRWGMLPTSS